MKVTVRLEVFSFNACGSVHVEVLVTRLGIRGQMIITNDKEFRFPQISQRINSVRWSLYERLVFTRDDERICALLRTG